MFRHDPHGPYKVHLYDDEQVHDAGGPPHTDERVTALCKGAETYGPLRPISAPEYGGDGHLCGTCVAVWESRRNAAEQQPEQPTKTDE